MTWRDISNEQNLELSQKMLQMQGAINELKAKLALITGERDQAREESEGHYEAACQLSADLRAAQAERDRALAEVEAVREENDRLHKLVDDLRQMTAADKALIDAAGQAVRSIRTLRVLLSAEARALIAAWDARAALIAPARPICPGCTVLPLGHEGECYQ